MYLVYAGPVFTRAALDSWFFDRVLQLKTLAIKLNHYPASKTALNLNARFVCSVANFLIVIV